MPTILARLGSTRPLLAYALCYFCGLALVTCKFSAAFCFRFCFVPELKQSEAPASSQTAQDPKLCATRNPKPNASYDSCCCCLSCCLCWHVARSRSWSLPIPPGPETVVVLPVNPRLFGVKRIRMSEMDLWHIPECPQSPHVR